MRFHTVPRRRKLSWKKTGGEAGEGSRKTVFESVMIQMIQTQMEQAKTVLSPMSLILQSATATVKKTVKPRKKQI